VLELKGSGSLLGSLANGGRNSLRLGDPFRFCQHGGNFALMVRLGLGFAYIAEGFKVPDEVGVLGCVGFQRLDCFG
jgi:hypothetical protein